MNVLMMAPSKVPHSIRPLRWLLGRGCSVTFVDRENPCPDGHERFRFVSYPGPSGRSTLRRVSGLAANVAARWRVQRPLRRLWSEVDPDVVHVHWVDERAYDCASAGLRPLVLTVWGSDINARFLPDDDPYNGRVVGEALAGADLVIVDSGDMPEKCARLAGREVPTTLLPLGVDTSLFRPLSREVAASHRDALGISEDALVFLSARALRPAYGHHHIIDAFARARPSLPRDSVLVVKTYDRQRVGDSYEQDLRRQIERLRLDEAVRWMEPVPAGRLPEVYALADIVVNYPSLDGFPVTFLEAAACERRVITCRLDAYRGTFAQTLFRMVELDAVAELADAFVDVAHERAEVRDALVREARAVVVREYDECVTADKLLALYRTLT